MSVLDDPKEYMKSPYFDEKKRLFGDYSAFYVAITICTIFAAFLFILNIYFSCCSNYQEYWQDSNTGNRWLLPLWTKTPHNQPPLDVTELERNYTPRQKNVEVEPPQGYIELLKRESDL